MNVNQEHAVAARIFNAIVGCTNRSFISGKEYNFSASHSSVENFSAVQRCKNNGKITKKWQQFVRALENGLVRNGCQEFCFFHPE